MTENRSQQLPLRPFVAEFSGTALLVFVGLSLVTVMFGAGTPLALIFPDEGLRRLITGFLFGTTGALIAISRIGKLSGAHINPIVTMAFRILHKITSPVAVGYILAQLAGAVVGALPLLLWGAMGRSVAFGATLPGRGYSVGTVLLGEVITTFIMVSLLILFLGIKQIRRFTPAIFPVLYAVMVFAEAPISGTSTNPARSLGPAVVSGEWQGWWIYWVGPAVGSMAACFINSFHARRIEVAKLFHFHHDPDGLFHRMPPAQGQETVSPPRGTQL